MTTQAPSRLKWSHWSSAASDAFRLVSKNLAEGGVVSAVKKDGTGFRIPRLSETNRGNCTFVQSNHVHLDVNRFSNSIRRLIGDCLTANYTRALRSYEVGFDNCE